MVIMLEIAVVAYDNHQRTRAKKFKETFLKMINRLGTQKSELARTLTVRCEEIDRARAVLRAMRISGRTVTREGLLPGVPAVIKAEEQWDRWTVEKVVHNMAEMCETEHKEEHLLNEWRRLAGKFTVEMEDWRTM